MTRLVALAFVSLAVASWHVSAQESSLRAERTIDFRLGRAQDLKATVGPVRVASVELSDLGRGYGQGRIVGIKVGIDSEASTTIRAHFLAENPSADEWAVTFSMEFLDKNGALIEKVTKRSTWEGEIKPYDLEHPLLAYVVPLIAKVRIKMEAKLD